MPRSLFLGVVFLIGCDGGGAGGPDGGPFVEQTLTLVSADWSLDPGAETYHCARVTITQELWIREFRPTAPEGTHHTVLSLDDAPTQPDGVYPCTDPFEVAPRLLYGSGVGSMAQSLPDGVAIRLPEGSQVVLNLHLFNTSDAPMSGTSAIDVVTVDPAEVTAEARVDLFGPFDLAISETATTFTASCTVAADLTALAVQPHMHQLGRHLRATPSR